MYRKKRKCQNPECEAAIEYHENPKKLFCNTSCKNRFHYLKDRVENHEVYEYKKALMINYNIIANFIDKGIYIIDLNVAKALGFNKKVYMDIKHFFPAKNVHLSLKRIKDVFFKYNIRKNVIILYYDN
jgi:hypothetical protein